MNKADKLDFMVRKGLNVAQFISVDRNNLLNPKYVHIRNNKNKDLKLKESIELLIKSASSKLVNIRSFNETITKGSRFVMGKGIEDIDEIIQIINENAENGLNSIINENINVSDGGVSGVVIGDIIEFSPDDTPRCVEKDGVCSLPRKIGLKMLETVYGFKPNLNFNSDYRVEFSIHPLKQGVYQQHTIIWEYERMEQDATAHVNFPNNFSKHLGDKVFGLLLADTLNFKVPKSTVISRNVKPFTFGTPTNNHEVWTRTAPVIKQPGKFTTCKGWTDPFKLMSKEDSSNTDIGSIICQNSIDGIYSGASFVKDDKSLDVIEGVKGNGDGFMVGEDKVEDLPLQVIQLVKEINDNFRVLQDILGDISFEWVYDGTQIWVVQLNQLKNSSSKPNIIVDGNVSRYIEFNTDRGLEELRDLLKTLNKDCGIKLVGNVGITSHFGDLLRQNQIPSFVVKIPNKNG